MGERLELADLGILLVEPSTMQQHVLRRILEDAGITRLDFVTTGQEALDALPRAKPDVIISSLYLEDMSSDLLLEKLRSGESKQHIPFILVSSETRFERLDPLRQAGVVAILPKPFDANDLRTALYHSLHHIEAEELELDSFDPSEVRVLIVDDSSLARKHTRHMLAEMGMRRFAEAKDGNEGIAIFEKEEFDLVVTDLNMPAMDGEQLTRYIRESRRSFVPILMLTSEQNKSKLAAIQQSGVSAIYDKPFEPHGIRRAIARLLNG